MGASFQAHEPAAPGGDASMSAQCLRCQRRTVAIGLCWIHLAKLLRLPFDDLRCAFQSGAWGVGGRGRRIVESDPQLLGQLALVQNRLGTEDASVVVTSLYSEMDIEDAKANGILQIVAVGVAIVTFLATLTQANAPLALRVITLVSLALLGWSVVTLSSLNLVFWSRTNRFERENERVLTLLYLSDIRSHVVRSSAIRAVLGFVMLTVAVGFAVGGVGAR